MELEKPDKASAGDNILNNINKIRAHNATRSDLIFPVMKKTVATSNMAKVIYMFSS